MNQFWGVDADPTAQGRIKGALPVAVLDIGSNSVRLVVYERHARALTVLYNEKTSCTLGRGMAATGRLADDNMERALTAMKRYALVTKLMKAGAVHVLATSAVRDATNRDEFVDAVERTMGVPVRVLSGEEEAHYAALGVVAGIPGFAGMVGDLGGGSLELSRIATGEDSGGETHELGVIRLQDDSGGSPAKAAALVRAQLKDSPLMRASESTFCAIGGTWRSLAKLHQVQRRYPLHMVQDYVAKGPDLAKLCEQIVEASSAKRPYVGASTVSSSRRDLVPFGAAVMLEVIKAGEFKNVVFSALGVREGYLYSLLTPQEKAVDPLLQAASEMSVLRSRSPQHAHDLIAFGDRFLATIGFSETEEEKRLRHVACLLSDIGWRGHPDYRGEQSIDLVAYGSMVGVGHPGRAFLAEVLAVRYMGLKHKSLSQSLIALSGAVNSTRARLIGALFRVAYPMSAAMPGVLPGTGFALEGQTLVLQLPTELAFLSGEHLRGRLEQLGTAAGLEKVAIR
ncbi:MAG TPA: Ppx/GppA phosphatase family protein [Devosiaceae bacterium]